MTLEETVTNNLMTTKKKVDSCYEKISEKIEATMNVNPVFSEEYDPEKISADTNNCDKKTCEIISEIHSKMGVQEKDRGAKLEKKDANLPIYVKAIIVKGFCWKTCQNDYKLTPEHFESGKLSAMTLGSLIEYITNLENANDEISVMFCNTFDEMIKIASKNKIYGQRWGEYIVKINGMRYISKREAETMPLSCLITEPILKNDSNGVEMYENMLELKLDIPKMG